MIQWDEGYVRVLALRGHLGLGARLRHRTPLAQPCRVASPRVSQRPQHGLPELRARVRMNGTYGWFTAAEIYDSVYNATSGTSSTKHSYARDGCDGRCHAA